jgi:hypothetical protein
MMHPGKILPWDHGRRQSPPGSARRAVPPQGYAHPATRRDVLGLGERIRAAMDAREKGGRRDALDREWHETFLELVRQVYVHCNQRGKLLDAVRVHYEGQIKEARLRIAELQRELQQVRSESAALFGAAIGSLRGEHPGIDGRTGGGGGEQDAQQQQPSRAQQRAEALASSASTLPVDLQSVVLARIVEHSSKNQDGAPQKLLTEALRAAAHSDRLTVLTAQVQELQISDVLATFSGACASLSTADRLRLIAMLAEHMEEAERTKQAIEICRGLSSVQSGGVAKQLIQSMSKLSRQPVVSSLVRGLTRDERISVATDVIGSVALGDLLQILTMRASEMAPADRSSLLASVVDVVSQQEREDLVQEQLVSMPNETRASMLGACFGLMTKDQRLDIFEMLKRTTGD